MLEDDFWHWSAVDVEGENGLIRRGMVIDMDAQLGFTVDFGYPEHRADLITSNKCYSATARRRYPSGDLQPGSSVEVLMRPSLDQPWCWFPSKVLAGPFGEYAFVTIDCRDETLEDIVPLKRIGCLPEMKYPFKCYKYDVELPSDQELLNLIKRKDFFRIWNQCTKTVGIAINQNKLTYLIRGDFNRVVKFQWKDSWIRTLIYSSTHPQPSASARRRIFTGPCRLPFNLENFSNIPHALQTPLSCINKVLPAEMILKTFSFLDVDDQIKCRRVCHKWNNLLEQPRRVKIDLSKYSEQHELALTIHKVVTNATRILVLTGNYPHANGIRFLPRFRIVIQMLKAKDIKVPVIVIAHRAIWADDLLDYSDPFQLTFRTEWSEVCEKLVLENVTLQALFEAQDEENRVEEVDVDFDSGCYDRYYTDACGVMLNIVKGVINTNKEGKLEDVLSILEEVCPEADSVYHHAVRFLEADLARICRKSCPAQQKNVLKMLRKWQPDDARFCSNGEWNHNDLTTIALESLRKVTVLALRYHLAERYRVREDVVEEDEPWQPSRSYRYGDYGEGYDSD